MSAAQLRKAKAIVQLWCDSGEATYPCYRALRDLAVLLGAERQPVASRASKKKYADALHGSPKGVPSSSEGT